MPDIATYPIAPDALPTMSIYVGFKHCDPAGIVFYPRYVEMLNDIVEHWFKNGIGIDFAELHIARLTGMPVISLECQFRKTSTLSETIDSYLTVTGVGRSSIKLSITVTKGGDKSEIRFSSNLVLVCMDLKTKTSMSIPDDVRRGIAPFVAHSGNP